MHTTSYIVSFTYMIIHLLVLSKCDIDNLDPQWNMICPSLVLKIWIGYGPAGNHTKTGIFVEREGINTIDRCIESCCEEDSCNVVFMYKFTCYQITCYTNDLCAPVFNTDIEKFGNNARMAFVRPVGNTEWPREILEYDEGDGMLADSASLVQSQACEVGVLIDCPVGEICTAVAMHSRSGVCQCMDGMSRNQTGVCVQNPQEPDKTNSTATVSLLQASSSNTPKPSSATVPQSSTPVPLKKLTVSVVSKEIRLPESEVSLSAYTVPAESNGEHYNYEWKLLSQPSPATDSTGAMQNAASSKLTLSHLSEGVYQFRVSVTGTHSAGEGYANVSVLPEMRLNQPPVATVTPERQIIKLPNSEAVLDASSSHDDDGGVLTYHWELTQGPLGYAPSLADTPTLQLHNLSSPGNYTFRLTVKDKQGASSEAQAWVTVVKETDYPPEANAGQDVILYLPRNALTLNGNRSTDDRGISSWEWTKAPSDSNKAVDMQDTRTPYLKLSDLEAGVYTFVLKVTDTAGQSSTAEVHVFVKQPSHLPPTADAGPDHTVVLPINWVILEAGGSNSESPPPSPQSPPAAESKQINWLWSQSSGPAPVHFVPSANLSKINATGLTRGVYIFKLVVTDITDGTSANDTVTVTVLQNTNAAPKANAGGDKTVSLPLTVLTLNGSASSDDLAVVKWLWSWDGSSLAQGTILANSDTTSVLMVGGVVPGQYVFKLKVEDEQGLTDEDTATIIVKPDPQLNSLARLTLGAASRSLRRSQLTSLLRQLSLLLHGGAVVTLRAVEEERNTGRAVVTFLAEREEQGAAKEMLAGPAVVQTLRTKLKQDPNLLDLPVAHIETVICQNNCSGHGVCDEATRQCLCEAFWMQDLIEQYFRDGESNCDWSLLYVVVAATMLLLGLCGLSWAAYCMVSPACRHRTPHKSSSNVARRSRRKASYSLLGSQEEEETVVGLGKSSRRLSLSDSDTDSDVLFETRSKINNGSMQMKTNGITKQGPKQGRRIKT